MKKYLLLIIGALAAPFAGHKAINSQKKLESAAQAAKDAAGSKSDVQIKPLNKILIAPQDMSGSGGGGKDKSAKSRRTLA